MNFPGNGLADGRCQLTVAFFPPVSALAGIPRVLAVFTTPCHAGNPQFVFVCVLFLAEPVS